MATFLFGNGDGKVFNEHGNETHVYEMEIDNEQYPLEQLTSYDQCIDFKPPEKPTRMKIEEPEEELANRQTWEPRIVLRDYRSYKDSDKEFFFLIFTIRI